MPVFKLPPGVEGGGLELEFRPPTMGDDEEKLDAGNDRPSKTKASGLTMSNGLALDAGELMLMVAGEFSMVGGIIKEVPQNL